MKILQVLLVLGFIGFFIWGFLWYTQELKKQIKIDRIENNRRYSLKRERDSLEVEYFKLQLKEKNK